MKSGGRRPSVTAVDVDDGTPTGIAVGVGSVMVVVAALLAALIPVAHTGWRFGVVTATVGVFGVLTRDGWAAVAVVVLGWLVVNGFLVDRMGELSWHGSPDLLRLMLLVLAGALGLVLGEGLGGLGELRARWRAGAEVAALVTENEEKERRDA